MENSENKTIIGYKGFDKDWKCRNFQYEVGKECEYDGDIKLCDKGYHFCENPHNVLKYYSAGGGHKFAVVEASEVSEEREKDSKRVAKRLKIKAEISVFEICKIAVSAFFENFGFKKKIESADTNNAGDCGAANAGDCGAARAGNSGAASAGYYGAANAGNYGAASAGYRGAASAGDYGAANAGNYGAANAGDYGAANAGNYGAANAGYRGAANAGNYGAASAGNYGVANAGYSGAAIVSNNGRVKGGYGCVLVARNIEWNTTNRRPEVTDWACGIVDNITIKEDVWYELKDGKLVQCEKQ